MIKGVLWSSRIELGKVFDRPQLASAGFEWRRSQSVSWQVVKCRGDDRPKLSQIGRWILGDGRGGSSEKNAD